MAPRAEGRTGATRVARSSEKSGQRNCASWRSERGVTDWLSLVCVHMPLVVSNAAKKKALSNVAVDMCAWNVASGACMCLYSVHHTALRPCPRHDVHVWQHPACVCGEVCRTAREKHMVPRHSCRTTETQIMASRWPETLLTGLCASVVLFDCVSWQNYFISARSKRVFSQPSLNTMS